MMRITVEGNYCKCVCKQEIIEGWFACGWVVFNDFSLAGHKFWWWHFYCKNFH